MALPNPFKSVKVDFLGHCHSYRYDEGGDDHYLRVDLSFQGFGFEDGLSSMACADFLE